MNITEAKTATQRDMDTIKFVMQLFPQVAAIVRTFDGKVYNKRFNNAIVSAFPDHTVHAYVSQYGGWLEVYYSRSYRQQYYFLRVRLEKLENKRIDAKIFEENMKLQLVRLWKELHALEECLQTCEADMQRLEAIENELRIIAGRFPYSTRDYFRPALYLRT